MAAGVEVQELDDFGLPIKKYGKSDSDVSHHNGSHDGASDEKKAAGRAEGDTPDTAQPTETVKGRGDGTSNLVDEEKSEPASQLANANKISRNSEEEDFQDAPSTPTPESPVPETSPEPAPKDDGAEHLEAHTLQDAETPAPTSDQHDTQYESLEAFEAAEAEEEKHSKHSRLHKRHSTKVKVQGISGPSIRQIEKSKKAEDAKKAADEEHRRDSQLPDPAKVVSEFSHQQLAAPHVEESTHGDEGWQTMPAYAPYDIYDDDNRLVAREHNDEDDETYGYAGLGGAGKGYTRVLADDEESETSLDGDTKYLFKETSGTSMVDEAEQRDAVAQLQATKDLLTEGQRIAYVGMVRLELYQMLSEAEDLKSTKHTKKAINLAAESMKMLAQKIMVRLYAHMEISTDEQVMIEQLAAHGVMPQDLTPTLMQNARVKNPMARRSTVSSTNSTPKIGALSPRLSLSTQGSGSEDQEPPPPYQVHEGSEMPDVKTPSDLPGTSKIDIDLRWTVLCDLFLVLIADSIYDARSRVLMERVGYDLEVSWLDLCRFEKRVTDALEMQQAAEKENWNEGGHLENRRKMALKRRYVMMGLATVGGGLVIGLSAGLLAPLIGAGLAAGFTTIGVSGTSGFLAGAGGTAIITAGSTASGSFMGARAANRRTGAVQTFEYRPLHNNKRVNLVVTVSGWMTSKADDVRLPFSTVDPIIGDIYSILWEPEMLTSMGDTINILATEALTQGLQQVLGSTILISLMAALQLPIVLSKLAYLIDNPWAVSCDRAMSAGLILADSLIDRNLGTRPITLIGFSLGSRVIFSCLMELARKGAIGLIQNVYMFGSPIVVKKDEFLKIRTIVAGRIVNGFNRNDWVLGYLFRLTNGGIRRVAGLAEVEDIPGLENMDCSEFVVGHMDYRQAMPRLMRECGWPVESDEFGEIDDPDPDRQRERQQELIDEIEEVRKELNKSEEKKGSFGFFSRKKRAERQEWEVYEESKGQPSGEGSKTEDKYGHNHGVLFDVDAIRAELAKEHEREQQEQEEREMELQVKELESTLPPMKIDSPIENPRGSLRETKSDDAATMPRSSNGAVGSPSSGIDYQSPRNAWGEEDDGIQMTFDDAYQETPQPTSSMNDAYYSPPARPEMKTSQTLPNIGVSNNPWDEDEDEDFGKEKEISMTFA